MKQIKGAKKELSNASVEKKDKKSKSGKKSNISGAKVAASSEKADV